MLSLWDISSCARVQGARLTWDMILVEYMEVAPKLLYDETSFLVQLEVLPKVVSSWKLVLK